MGYSQKPGFNDYVRRTFYPGWNDYAAMQADWRDTGDKAWFQHQQSIDPVYQAQQKAARDKAAADKAAAAKQAQWTSDRAAFDTRTKQEGEQFLTGFREEYPTILSGLRSDLDLEGLRETTRGGFENLESIEGDVSLAAQGRDVSASQLDRMIRSRENKLYPDLQKMVGQQQFAEEEYGRRSTEALMPYEMDFNMLSDRWARESSGFDMNMEGQLNILLEQLRQTGNLSANQMQQATALAELESKKEQLQMSISAGQYSHAPTAPTYSSLNLGGEYQVLKDGQPYGNYPIGLGPTRGTGDTFGSDASTYLLPQGSGSSGYSSGFKNIGGNDYLIVP